MKFKELKKGEYISTTMYAQILEKTTNGVKWKYKNKDDEL